MANWPGAHREGRARAKREKQATPDRQAEGLISKGT